MPNAFDNYVENIVKYKKYVVLKKAKDFYMVTMQHIAQLANVSRGTVDRVLNNRGAVSKETAKKVREIAASLNYTPSKAARSLAAMKRNIKLYFIMWDPNINDFFQQVLEGAQKAAADLQNYGVTVKFLYSHFDNVEEQNALLSQAVAGNASGIAIAGVNAPSTAAKIRKIQESGIPVVTVNSDISDCNRLAFVGSDSVNGGEIAAAMIRMITQGTAQVGIIIGSHNSSCHMARVSGFKRNIEKNAPNIHIVKVAENMDEDFESFSVTKDLLKEHPEINTLFLTGAGVYGACRAVESAQLETPPLIICYDCTKNTQTMLKKGVITASICQHPEIQGSKPLEILFNYIALGILPESENYFTKAEILIRESL